MDRDTQRGSEIDVVSRRVVRSAQALLVAAGLLGAAGVGLAAAAAHKGGGELTAIAATFAILHAGAVVSIVGVVIGRPRLAWSLLVPALAMIVGAVMFSGDLALIGLADWRPWPQAAPIGGTVMILAWLAVSLLSVARMGRLVRPAS